MNYEYCGENKREICILWGEETDVNTMGIMRDRYEYYVENLGYTRAI